MEEAVLALALELAGMTQGEAQSLSLCCRMAVEELKGMLRPGVSPEACGEKFVWTAAQLALADWWELGGQPKKFTAGDVTVEEGRIDPAELRTRALRRMADQIRLPGTAIRGVRS